MGDQNIGGKEVAITDEIISISQFLGARSRAVVPKSTPMPLSLPAPAKAHIKQCLTETWINTLYL